jgi:hypothetical protein
MSLKKFVCDFILIPCQWNSLTHSIFHPFLCSVIRSSASMDGDALNQAAQLQLMIIGVEDQSAQAG